MSTYREQLSKLPDGYAELAIERTSARVDDEIAVGTPFAGDVISAIYGAFLWDATPEGHQFWSDVAEAYSGERDEYPPLPVAKESEVAS
jgi:hypothetical protein